MQRESYDVIIIGAGPGGLTCALYCSRAGFSVAVLDRGLPGGQMAMTEWVDNYPGFPEGIKGEELAQLMVRQAERFGVEMGYGNVIDIIDREEIDCLFTVALDSEEKIKGKILVIGTGAKPRTLGLEGEHRMVGRGVSYCAVCDGNFFKGREVCVIGGGDSAVEEAVYLSRLCSKVTIVHRRDKLRAAQMSQEAAFQMPNIEFVWNSQLKDVLGDISVEGIVVVDVNTGEEKTIHCSGVFLYVGITPQTDIVKGKVDMDAQGFIKTDENMQTSWCGVYAIGDVRRPAYRQITSAVGDGTTAALHIDVAINKKPDRWRNV